MIARESCPTSSKSTTNGSRVIWTGSSGGRSRRRRTRSWMRRPSGLADLTSTMCLLIIGGMLFIDFGPLVAVSLVFLSLVSFILITVKIISTRYAPKSDVRIAFKALALGLVFLALSSVYSAEYRKTHGHDPTPRAVQKAQAE